MGKKLLFIGVGPLPFEKAEYNSAAGIRTWTTLGQISKIIRPEDIDIYLFEQNGAYRLNSQENFVKKTHAPYTYTIIPEAKIGADILEHLISWKNFSSIVTSCSNPSYIMSITKRPDIPWWADLYGDPLTEGQSKAYTAHDNKYVQYTLAQIDPILRTADKISTCSIRQKYMTIGELAMVGRLSKENEGVDLVHYIPIPFQERNSKHVGSKRKSFQLLWIGGYNTWSDPDTLFNGLYKAMKRNPHIRFVSTGGGIKNHDDLTFARFKRLVDKSDIANRVHFRGYVTSDQLTELLATSDVGLNVDRFNYEGMIGGRTRVNTFVEHGLPVLTSDLSEIPHLIKEHDLGLTFSPGDDDMLAEQILWATGHQEELQKKTDRAYEYFKKSLHPDEHYAGMREWIQQPTRTFKHTNQIAGELVHKPSRKDKKLFFDIVKYGYKGAVMRMLS